MMTLDNLRAALAAAVADLSWLESAQARVAAEPATIARLFPAAGRHSGRDTPLAPVDPTTDWTAQDAARVLLLSALPLRDHALAAVVEPLYRYGDAAEKRAVLRALPVLPLGPAGGQLVPLLHDAIRTNDPRLLAAALGPYARRLDDAAWRQAVLKCVFMEVPLARVDGLDARADPELGRMLAGLARERRAAGRSLPADAEALLTRLES